MKVIFDVSCLNHHQLSGVGVYALHLAAALSKVAGLSLVGGVRLSRLRKLDTIRRHFKGPVFPFPESFPLWPWRNHDIFHGPDFRLPSVKSIPRVVTIHDLAVFEDGFSEPEFLERGREALWTVLEKNPPQAVIAVSDFTKGEIVRRFPNLKNKVFRVYHGCDHLPLSPHDGPSPGETISHGQGRLLQKSDPYFLFVGNLEKRKNVAGLIRAFSILSTQNGFENHRLMLVGKPGFAFNEIQNEIDRSSARARIRVRGFLSSAELAQTFSSALAFVYPSFYEGFGFPLLEAMRQRVPVVTSGTSATGEAAGDAALKVGPGDDDALALAMREVSENTQAREKLIEKGFRRSQEFTWSKCSLETFHVYNQALAINS